MPTSPTPAATHHADRQINPKQNTVVVRWIKDEAALNEFLGRVIGAMGAAN